MGYNPNEVDVEGLDEQDAIIERERQQVAALEEEERLKTEKEAKEKAEVYKKDKILQHRLAVHAIACDTGFHGFDQRGETKCRCALVCAVGACDCHVRYPIICRCRRYVPALA